MSKFGCALGTMWEVIKGGRCGMSDGLLGSYLKR